METLANGQLNETTKRGQQAGADLKKNASKVSNEAVSRFEDVASQVQDVVQTKFSQFSDSAMAYRADAEGYVRKNPLTWVMGAALVGITLGFLFSFIRPVKR